MSKIETRNPNALYCDDPSLTIQSASDQCDINQIIARVLKGNDLTHINNRVAQYGDVSQIPDYQTALDTINRANGFFMDLSPQVRERFSNDPGKMIAFLQDPANRAEAVKLGLVVPPKVDPPAVVPAVPPAPAGSGASSSPAV